MKVGQGSTAAALPKTTAESRLSAASDALGIIGGKIHDSSRTRSFGETSFPLLPCDRVRARLRLLAAWAALIARLEGSARARWELAATVIAALTILVPPLVVVGPWLADTSTYGFHDWDVQTSHRFLAKRSLLEHGELPAWNPYACGGFPAWGYVESGTILVSPWLPLYLFGDIRVALRVEVLGMALLGAVGTYLAAARFTESRGARALVVALFAVNGRWALQAAAGHTWHLAYALLPWALWAFERARAPGARLRDVVALAVTLALLVYWGGIYPLPHTVLVLGLWSLAACSIDRSPRPVLVLAVAGALSVGLSAPKLFPMLATFSRAPRLIESTESLSLGAFVTLLTSREQGFGDRPADVFPYGWHEWGMYIGVPGAVILCAAFVFVSGRREALLKLLGAALVVLGFGAFHPSAPWPWLHEHVPVFRSQHVPSRFLYPAVLVLGLVAAVGVGRFVARAGRRHLFADAVIALAALGLALDVASVARKPMKDAMWMVAPPIVPDETFRFDRKPPYHYVRRDWAGPMYLAMLGNRGVLDCYGAPPFDERGALSHRDRRYRGEAFVDGGEARVVRWTPSSAEIEVKEAREGAELVYNMNFDSGWRASVVTDSGSVDVTPAPNAHRVAVRLPGGARRVTLTYVPPGLGAGLAALTLTLLCLGLYAWSRRGRSA